MNTIVHIDEPATLKDWGGGLSTIKTRTEVLRKYAATQQVPNEILRTPEGGLLAQDIFLHLRERIERDVAAVGRQVHGDITISRHEDFMRDAIAFRAECLTREITDGVWAEVHAARRQDAQDLIDNIETDWETP